MTAEPNPGLSEYLIGFDFFAFWMFRTGSLTALGLGSKRISAIWRQVELNRGPLRGPSVSQTGQKQR
jgi:hypothetical protein